MNECREAIGSEPKAKRQQKEKVITKQKGKIRAKEVFASRERAETEAAHS
jgi:hypothetical protein